MECGTDKEYKKEEEIIMEKCNRVKAVISLDAVEENFRQMRKNIASDTKMIAVIKANAYGHGAVQIAHMIEGYDYIWGFAVATAEEAIALRKAGITKPVLILGIIFEEFYPELVSYDLRPAVCEYQEAAKLSAEAVSQGKTIHIHLALDTGMTRIGFADEPSSVEKIKKIAALPGLEIEGMFTHFARADEYDRSPLLQQCRYYPYSGSKFKHCQSRNYNLWHLSFCSGGEGYCEIVSGSGVKEPYYICKGCTSGHGNQLWRNLCGRQEASCGNSAGGLCGWLPQTAFWQRMGSGPWKEGTDPGQSLHGSVHDRCDRNPGCEEGRPGYIDRQRRR